MGGFSGLINDGLIAAAIGALRMSISEPTAKKHCKDGHVVCPLTLDTYIYLNESKPEFMIIGTRQQLSKINRITPLVGSDRVESVTEARTLGVLFDCNFNFLTKLLKQLV